MKYDSMVATTQNSRSEQTIRSFSARYDDRQSSIAERLRGLDIVFRGDTSLMFKAMRAAEQVQEKPSFDYAASLLDCIKQVATPVIRTGAKEEMTAVYMFMNSLTLFGDVDQRLKVASHIVEAMNSVERTEELSDGAQKTALAAINRALSCPLSSSMPENFEHAVNMTAVFESASRVLKLPEGIVALSGLLIADWGQLQALLRKKE
jgi:hypothetical protein